VEEQPEVVIVQHFAQLVVDQPVADLPVQLVLVAPLVAEHSVVPLELPVLILAQPVVAVTRQVEHLVAPVAE
jgi:hypothetical protein